jgi:hypothetical protein
MPSPVKSDSSKSSPGTQDTNGLEESGIRVAPVEKDTKLRCYDRDKWMKTVLPRLEELALAAVHSYKHSDEKALRNKKSFDGPVEVKGIEEVFPDKLWVTAEQLGELCMATGSGVKLDAFPVSKKIHVRQYASGYKHAGAVGCVSQEITAAARPYFSRPRYAVHTSDRTYGSLLSTGTAPDFVLSSWGVPGGGRAYDTREAPLFIAEVDHGNRTLPELIRHLGMLLGNFPNLNGVVGFKGKEKPDGRKVVALVAIEWGSVGRNACVTRLIDFGPDSLSDTERTNAVTTLGLPRPGVGIDPVAGQNGAGVIQQLPDWERVPNGIEETGDDFVYHISPLLLLVGAHSAEGEELLVPTELAPARINLADLADVYFG